MTLFQNRKPLVFFSVIVLLIVSFLFVQSTVTAEDPDNPNGFTTVMQLFAEDQQATNTDLARMPLTPCVAGDAGGYPCSNVDLAAFMPFSALGGGTNSANDIWGWTDAGSGREFALMGRTNGTVFVEITNPVSPVYIGNLPTATANSSWRDIKTYSDHAYIVSEAGNHGMQVFDLTQLLTAAPGTTFAATTRYTGFGSAHNVVINEDSGYAYGVGAGACSGGLAMVNIQNPAAPVNAGCFATDGYTHDAECVIYNGPDLAHIGKEICFNSNEDTLTIVDVTNKAAPVQLSRVTFGARYSHQSWATENMEYVLLDDELDESGLGHNTRTHIWNVQDLDAPVRFSTFDSTAAAIDHNQYVKGHLTYQSNYRAGLRILDVTNVAAGGAGLSEVGFFDVYPTSDSANFNGTWSNYPYFQNDAIAVSHIESGLFILQTTGPAASADFVITPQTPLTDVVLDDARCIDSMTFELDAVNGFNSAVALSVAGAPAGAVTTFSPASVTPDGTSVFSVDGTGLPPAAAGAYLLTVPATGGGITHTEYLRWDIPANCMPPTAVTLNSASPVAVAPTLWAVVLFGIMALVSVAGLRRRAVTIK